MVKDQENANARIDYLERLNAEYALIADMHLGIAQSTDIRDVAGAIIDAGMALFGSGAVWFVIPPAEGNHDWQLFFGEIGGEVITETVSVGEADWLEVLENPAIIHRMDDQGELLAIISYPLTHEGKVVGIIDLREVPAADHLDEYLHTLSVISSPIPMVLQKITLYDKLLTLKDTLESKNRELIDAQDRLIELERSAAAEDALSSMRGEIDQPLATILRGTESLLFETNLPVDAVKSLNVVRESSKRLMEIMDKLPRGS